MPVFIHVYNLGSSFEQTMMGPSPQCYIPSHKVICPLVLERKIFKGFYHIHLWTWRPSWSHDPDPANKLSFPHSTEASYEIGQAVLEKKVCENGGRRTDGRGTDNGPRLYFKLTNEPKASCELKSRFSWVYLNEPFNA